MLDNIILINKLIATFDIFVQEFIFDVGNLKVTLSVTSQIYNYIFLKENNYSGIINSDFINVLDATN